MRQDIVPPSGSGDPASIGAHISSASTFAPMEMEGDGGTPPRSAGHRVTRRLPRASPIGDSSWSIEVLLSMLG